MGKHLMLILAIMLASTWGSSLHAMDVEKCLNCLNEELLTTSEVAAMFSVENRTKIISKLIDEGANVNYQNFSGLTALMAATMRSNHKLERLVVIEHNPELMHLVARNNRGFNPNYSETWMPMLEENRHAIVHLLIEKGANVNLQDKDGNTALAYAAKNNFVEICTILISAMLKLTKEQKDSVYALIASLKRTPELKTSKDTRRLIAQDLIDMYKKENRAKASAEIEKIRDRELKNQLLQFLESQ